MNAPPSDGRRVPVEDLRDFVAGIFAAVPVSYTHLTLPTKA